MEFNSQKSILLKPWRWKLVTQDGISQDVLPIKDSVRQQWSFEHAHQHTYRELLLVLKGDVYMGVNNEIYPCSPGTLFFFEKQEAHDNEYPENSPDLDHFWIMFIKGAFNVTFISVRDGKCYRPYNVQVECCQKGLPDISRPFNELWSGFDHFPVELKKFKLFSAITQIIGSSVELAINPPTKDYIDSLKKTIIERLCAHIDECLGIGINLKDIARLSGYSMFHFHRLFEQHTGVTLHQYVNRIRKKEVDKMLQQGYSKKEISYKLGFSCPATFSRWFRKNYK